MDKIHRKSRLGGRLSVLEIRRLDEPFGCHTRLAGEGAPCALQGASTREELRRVVKAIAAFLPGRFQEVAGVLAHGTSPLGCGAASVFGRRALDQGNRGGARFRKRAALLSRVQKLLRLHGVRVYPALPEAPRRANRFCQKGGWVRLRRSASPSAALGDRGSQSARESGEMAELGNENDLFYRMKWLMIVIGITR